MSKNSTYLKTDKDIILSEFSKTATRLQNKGCDMNGTFFGVNDRIREPRTKKIEPIINPVNIEDTKEEPPQDHIVWKPENEFIKVYPDELNRIAFRLSGAETLTLIRLITFIDYESGMLKKDKKPLITKDIIELTGFSKVTVIAIMEKLVSERLLSKNRVGRTAQFLANPYIFFKGKYINKTLIDMFKDYRKIK